MAFVPQTSDLVDVSDANGCGDDVWNSYPFETLLRNEAPKKGRTGMTLLFGLPVTWLKRRFGSQAPNRRRRVADPKDQRATVKALSRKADIAWQTCIDRKLYGAGDKDGD